MRISDWSSDVCSSDLTTDANNYQARVDDARNQLNTAISQLKSIASANGYNQQQLTEIQSQQANTVDTLKIRIGKIQDLDPAVVSTRSKERSVGKECVQTFRTWWSPDH